MVTEFRELQGPKFVKGISDYREPNGSLVDFAFRNDIIGFARAYKVPLQEVFNGFVRDNLDIPLIDNPQNDNDKDFNTFVKEHGFHKPDESEAMNLEEAALLSYRLDSQGGIIGLVYLIKALGLQVGSNEETIKSVLSRHAEDLMIVGTREALSEEIEALLGVSYGSVVPRK